MSKSKPKVASLEIKLPDGSSLKLSLDEARSLYTSLGELFDVKESIRYIPNTSDRTGPYRWPPNPIIWEAPDTGTPEPYRWSEITCFDDAGNQLSQRHLAEAFS